jgi:hypothetical protein
MTLTVSHDLEQFQTPLPAIPDSLRKSYSCHHEKAYNDLHYTKNERLSNTNATKNWDELGCSEGQTVPTPKVTLVMLLLLQIMNEERQRLITINLVYLSWWQL